MKDHRESKKVEKKKDIWRNIEREKKKISIKNHNCNWCGRRALVKKRAYMEKHLAPAAWAVRYLANSGVWVPINSSLWFTGQAPLCKNVLFIWLREELCLLLKFFFSLAEQRLFCDRQVRYGTVKTYLTFTNIWLLRKIKTYSTGNSSCKYAEI